MGMNLRISAGSGLLNVIVTGEFSLKEAQRTFIEMLDAVAEQKAKKILCDGREVKGEPEHFQRFLYGKFAAETVERYIRERGIPLPQFAYVLHVPVLDPRRFGEIVAVKWGMWVKAFDNLEDALEWLR